MITVYDLLSLFINDNMQEVVIWNFAIDKNVYSGFIDEIPDKYLYAEIESIDNLVDTNDVLVINIYLEETE